MTRITIKKIIWDDWNKEHIKKHKVTITEVEIAIKQIVRHKRGKKSKYILLARSGMRILALIVGREKPNVYYLASARDASKKERKLVYEKEKK